MANKTYKLILGVAASTIFIVGCASNNEEISGSYTEEILTPPPVEQPRPLPPRPPAAPLYFSK